MMSVAIDPSASELIAGSPVGLFEDTYVPGDFLHPNYDVSPDGSRLLMVKSEQPQRLSEIRILQGWSPERGSVLQRNR